MRIAILVMILFLFSCKNETETVRYNEDLLFSSEEKFIKPFTFGTYSSPTSEKVETIILNQDSSYFYQCINCYSFVYDSGKYHQEGNYFILESTVNDKILVLDSGKNLQTSYLPCKLSGLKLFYENNVIYKITKNSYEPDKSNPLRKEKE